MTKGPAALPVARAHLEVQGTNVEATGGVLMGSCEAEGCFLVPLGKYAALRKGKMCCDPPTLAEPSGGEGQQSKAASGPRV